MRKSIMRYVRILPLVVLGIASALFMFYGLLVVNTSKVLYVPFFAFLLIGGMVIFATSMNYRPEVRRDNDLLSAAKGSHKETLKARILGWVISGLLMACLTLATFVIATN